VDLDQPLRELDLAAVLGEARCARAGVTSSR